MALKINEKLDLKQLAGDFKKISRVQILDFFEPESAEEVFKNVSGCRNFRFKYNDGPKEIFVKPLELGDMTEDELRKMGNLIFNAAMEGRFQYTCYACPLDENSLAEYPALKPLKGLFDFLNGKDMKAFLKAVSGEATGAATAEVQWHKTDSFQTTGDGTREGEQRLLGYSLEMTKDWNPDGGGLTLFKDDNGTVEEVYTPRFNALTLHKVPMNHSMSYITGYAKGVKLVVTGCFMAG